MEIIDRGKNLIEESERDRIFLIVRLKKIMHKKQKNIESGSLI